MILAVATKSETEKVRVVVDWSPLLGDDVIASHEVTAPSPLALVGAASLDTDAATSTFVLEGGVAGTTYDVDLVATTDAGAEIEGEALIIVGSVLEVGVNTGVALADADEYFALRRNTTWMAAGKGAREAALMRGTAYVEGRFAGRWPGTITDSDQLLSWPRRNAYDLSGRRIDSDVWPEAVKQAIMEAAVLEVGTPGFLFPTEDRDAFIIEETTGPLTTRWSERAKQGAQPTIPSIDSILSSLIFTGGSTGFMLRA